MPSEAWEHRAGRAPAAGSQFPVAHQNSNPHPCGFYGDNTRECRCTPGIIQRYLAKVSGPLLDRIDLRIEVPAVPYKELRGKTDGQTLPRFASEWKRHATYSASAAITIRRSRRRSSAWCARWTKAASALSSLPSAA